jgi:hypothetical protein
MERKTKEERERGEEEKGEGEEPLEARLEKRADILSALSLPKIPLWPGIQTRLTLIVLRRSVSAFLTRLRVSAWKVSLPLP